MSAKHRLRRAGTKAVPSALKPALRHARDARRTRRAVALLLDSGLFDTAWYVAQTGCDPDPERAARHYLTVGTKLDASPHPLISNAYLRARHTHRVGARNPLLAYLRDPVLRASSRTHPLFDVTAYVAAHPAAARFPSGATGHYVAMGAPAGAAPNAWYEPDSQAQPGGLADWIRARAAERYERNRVAASPWTTTPPPDGPAPEPPAWSVSVVLPAGPALDLLAAAAHSVLAQTVTDLELVVAHPPGARAAAAEALGEAAKDERVRLVEAGATPDAVLLDAGGRAATGDWLAFCLPAVRWRPGHLAHVLAAAADAGADAAYDVVQFTEKGVRRWATVAATRERSLAAGSIHLGALAVRRAVLDEMGGIDAGLPAEFGYDLELRLLARGPVPLAAAVGVELTVEDERAAAEAVMYRERAWIDPARLPGWPDAVAARHLLDWSAVDPDGDPTVVSVVITSFVDADRTEAAVAAVRAAAVPDGVTVEVVVVDNGSALADAVTLESIPLRHPGVQLLHEPVARTATLAANRAVARTRGATVVFLGNDTEVAPGWLGPLVDALRDPQILGAQALLLRPTGTVASAGYAFPSSGGLPHALLEGHPVEDAHGVEGAALSAASGAALALRRRDVVALRGFDPLFGAGLDDVDLGLRLSALRPGRFTVREDSVVVHHQSRTAGRFTRARSNRRILLRRYGSDLPGDDVVLWGGQGYDVLAHECEDAGEEERRLEIPRPLVFRRRPAEVTEGPPRLRWALKNPAPAHEADLWGDTHFIRHLATALRRHGQEVVIDYRGAFDRASGRHDDVVLVIRGLAPYRPVFGQVSMAWVISHPEMFSRREAEAYDRVFAASEVWARRRSQEWELRIDPLLQATAPELFHPDRARPDSGHRVLFVGGSRQTLRPMVRDAIAAGLPMSIYGAHWDGFVPADDVLAPYLANAEVGAAYRGAGVVLNDHWDDMRADGFLSNRLFDAAASGARVVTDDIEGVDRLFGRSVQVSRSATELAALVDVPDLDAVFGDDAERRAVAARVHAEHSFDARAAVLLDAALELRAALSRSAGRTS